MAELDLNPLFDLLAIERRIAYMKRRADKCLPPHPDYSYTASNCEYCDTQYYGPPKDVLKCKNCGAPVKIGSSPTGLTGGPR